MNLRDIHTPVFLERCIQLLAPALERDGAVFVDATLGMGGHSEAFLERFPASTSSDSTATRTPCASPVSGSRRSATG